MREVRGKEEETIRPEFGRSIAVYFQPKLFGAKIRYQYAIWMYGAEVYTLFRLKSEE
jgi:hypothetical protein